MFWHRGDINLNQIVHTCISYFRFKGRAVVFKHVVSERSVGVVPCRVIPVRYTLEPIMFGYVQPIYGIVDIYFQIMC